jgi:hypothetical protein
MRYTWRELEPSFDRYDFSAVAAHLALLEGTGRQLVALVIDKSFQDERYTPDYLWNEHTLPVNSIATGLGYVSKRWDPYVMVRMNKLFAELGAAFDTHPRFEGVALSESALGVDSEVLQAEGYTAARYRDSLIDVLRSINASMPRSRVFWYGNFIPWGQQYLHDIANAVGSQGVALGGPDVLPDDWALENLAYPMLRAQPPNVIRFNSVQFVSYRHEHLDPEAATKYWTPRELIHFARDDLKVRYLFWNRMVHPKPADSYGILDAFPVMAEEPLYTGSPTLAPRPPVLAGH